MKKITLAGVAVIAGALGAYAFTRSTPQTASVEETAAPSEGAPMVAVTLPDTLSAEAALGKQAFDAVCADCHGENAAGKMGFAPPLIHKIYEPSHHGDMAFQMACACAPLEIRGHAAAATGDARGCECDHRLYPRTAARQWDQLI